MFEKMKNIEKKLEKKIEKAIVPMTSAAAALGFTSTVGATTLTADNAMNKIIEVVFKIFRYIGILLAIWGAGSLIMAFKNEDADSKSRAIMCLIVGIALVTLQTLFKGLVDDLLKSTVSSVQAPSK